MLRVLDLFSGIGGFSLGLERTGGFKTVAFCEIDPFCRRVLAKHWPDVPCYDDVRALTADALERDGITVDVICGGFPCQDISHAGKRAGLEGARSGLWREYARIIGELRPRFVIVENVAGLLSLGLGDVLGDLAALGYDATWDCIPASAVGAPHRRDRVWLVAHPGRRIKQESSNADQMPLRGACKERSANSIGGPSCDGRSEAVADANCPGLSDGRQTREPLCPSEAIGGMAQPEPQRCGGAWWAIEPDVGRVAHGVSSRVDRLRSLGNAVVPQVVEVIGRAILAAERAEAAPSMCKFMAGDPLIDARVCGRATMRGRVYCADHAALCYVPADPKKKPRAR